MAAAAGTETAPADDVKPKRKLSLAKATVQWLETERAIQGLEPLRKEAKAVIVEHAERTGRRVYGGGTIAVEQTGGSLVLDQPAVKKHLGDRVSAFMVRTKLGLTLKLLR